MNRLCALLLLSILFMSFAAASLVSVIIQPRSGNQVVSLYPNEVVVYDVYVINNGSDVVENLVVVVSTDPELTILIDGAEASEKEIRVAELRPNAQEIVRIDVKALQSGEMDFRITANYGSGSMDNSVSTKLMVVENPIYIDSRLDKTALNPGDEASVVLGMTNTSSHVLTNVVAELIVSDGLTSQNEPYGLEALDPKQSFTNKEFRFLADADTIGKREVTLRIRYSDKEGEHLIENIFIVDVQNRTAYLFIIIVGIVVLIVISYVLRQKKEPPKIDVSGVKIEEINGPPAGEKKP